MGKVILTPFPFTGSKNIWMNADGSIRQKHVYLRRKESANSDRNIKYKIILLSDHAMDAPVPSAANPDHVDTDLVHA